MFGKQHSRFLFERFDDFTNPSCERNQSLRQFISNPPLSFTHIRSPLTRFPTPRIPHSSFPIPYSLFTVRHFLARAKPLTQKELQTHEHGAGMVHSKTQTRQTRSQRRTEFYGSANCVVGLAQRSFCFTFSGMITGVSSELPHSPQPR